GRALAALRHVVRSLVPLQQRSTS
ncbi:MAG: hypothetical protein QOE29_2160, partial [Gaiellaceae bacterium]|nr:hypothetical protein [Gaiellaceae bacterium]